MKIAKPKPPERLTKLTEELFRVQEEYAGKAMPEDVGEEFEAKAQEAEKLQDAYDAEVKNWERMERLRRSQATIDEPTLPADEPEEKASKNGAGRIAGYLTLGEAVVKSEAYQSLAKNSFRGGTTVLVVPELKKGLVPLTKAQREEYEAKAVPTLGTDVIEPDRVDGLTYVTAPDETVLRDVLNVSRTNSDSVDYLREESYTRAAAPTAAGSAKPEATIEYSVQSASVRTIAVWIPVTTQMLADWPQIRNLIDARLLYDLRKDEEELVMYGDGTGQNFEGILVASGTTDIDSYDTRNVATPTNIDRVRVGITEVRRNGYSPNALVIHPIDWEDMVLEKGSDDHYLAQVFPQSDGTMRVWGLRVVESIAAQENAGNATEERNFVVGDFIRGATLWVREAASVQVGLNSDDFTKNKRTLLAEERAAFAVQAPKAFAYYETQALSAS